MKVTSLFFWWMYTWVRKQSTLNADTLLGKTFTLYRLYEGHLSIFFGGCNPYWYAIGKTLSH